MDEPWGGNVVPDGQSRHVASPRQASWNILSSNAGVLGPGATLIKDGVLAAGALLLGLVEFLVNRFAALGRSAQNLLAVAPRLRAKGAGAVIATLLDEDAVLPSARRSAISDRGARRLFDRLVALGGVRELTGRSTFRLYGL